MDYVIAFFILGIFLFTVAFLALDKYQQIQKREWLKIPKKAPVTDDCIWQAKKMVGYLNDRLHDTGADGFAECGKGMNGNFFTLYDSHDIVDLVRYAHLAGCHITIEQIAEHDIESPRNTKECLKKYHTDLKRSLAERLEAKYSS